MRITILGCGTSTGVPRIGNDWGVCDPNEPKNRRSRCSIMVEEGATRILVDTSPDLREQMLAANVMDIDAVVYTHDHADQTHGIDDLRVFALTKRRKVDIYGDADTLASLKKKFAYCFEDVRGYFAILKPHEIGLRPFDIGGLAILPIDQDHGTMRSLGYRFGDVAYSNDLVHLPDEAFEKLAGLKVWIVDALRYNPHPTHSHLERTLGWIERLKPQRAILTNMHIDLDYQTLRRELPAGVEPGYDGMVIEA
jgi:phosphoribosyl 1,2-cyclic phosphate phosphodiesterase